MARNKKVEILSNDKEVLHPMTDGDCVIFEDGQTLTRKLSEDDSVKYTPEIVNSSPMFKVGEGNTVDYSDNVLDSTYKRATLQGQTYVNYIQEYSADEVTLPTPFTEYERTQHNTLTSDEEGTLGINLVGQSYVNALQHDSEEEYVVLGESLEFQEKKVEYTNEGQIKSAMLKGQTLVNLATRNSGTTSENKYYTLENIVVKPSTKYFVKFNISITNKDGFNDDSNIFRIDEFGADGVESYVGKITVRKGVFESSNQEIITEIIETQTNTASIRIILRNGFNDGYSNTLTVNNIQVIEYQEGMENWDIPYFEGMQSVTVSTKLENLCHKQNSSTAKNGKTFNTNSLDDRLIVLNGVTDGGATSYGMKPNTKYLIQFKVSNLVLDGLGAFALTFSTSTVNTGNCLFAPGTVENLVTSNGVYRVVLTTSNLISTSSVEIKGIPSQWENSGSSLRKMTISEIMYVEYQNGMENWDLPYFEDYQVMKPIQVETHNDYDTTNELYQSKTTYSWDEVILRKIGDVEDTLDLTTGEWVQRIDEISFNSSNISNWRTYEAKNEYSIAKYTLPHYINGRGEIPSTKLLCDKIKVATINEEVTQEQVCAYHHTTTNSPCSEVRICVLTSKLVTADIDGIQAYISDNPFTIQYILETPIVHKVNLSRPNLQVYDDITHVHTKCLDGTLIPNIYLPSDISYPAILEPSTTYNVCIDHTEVSADNQLTVNVGGTEIAMTDSRMTLTTPTTLANSNVSFTGKGNKIKESMLIKNSSLLTGDLQHFNGIGSVQLGKTIENLCSSNATAAGGGAATITTSNDYIDVTMTKTGSYVFLFELLKVLEDGKSYFIYAPNTYPTTAQCYASFMGKIQGSVSYVNDAPTYGHEKYWILTINHKTDNPYSHLCLGQHNTISVNTNFRLQKPIICEYEPGMENWDWESIGYFTGTKNIGNEFMRVQNKNLFDSNNLILGANQYWVSQGYEVNIGHTLRATLSQLIQVTPGCTLTLTFGSNYQGVIQEYISGDKRTHYNDNGWHNDIHTLKLNEKTKYVNIYFRKKDDTQFTTDELDALKNSIQIEESSTATTYTAHKHNGLYITKDQPIELTWEQGRINPSGVGDSYTNAINNAVSYGIRNKGLLNLKPNTTYRISLGDKTNFKYHIAVFDNWNNALASNSLVGISGDWVSSRDTIFTTTKDAHKIGINIQKQDASSITLPETVYVQIRLEEVTDVVLRSIDDVHDELDITRGIYTQRISEIVLDGSEQALTIDTSSDNTLLIMFNSIETGLSTQSVCICDKLPFKANSSEDFEHMRMNANGKVCFWINKTKFEELNVASVKKYLLQNPITVQYPLVTPIVHKVHIGNKNEANTEVTKPNDVFTLPTLYTEQTHIDLTNNGIMPKVQSRDYIAYPVLPMINRTYTLQHNLTGGVSNLTVDLLGRTQEITYQEHRSIIYSPETMDVLLHNELRISGKGKIGRVMYVDGEYMDRDIPYIEGMKNAVNPIVKNVGKNFTTTKGGNTNFFIDRIVANKTYYLYTERSSDVYYNLICFEEKNNKSHGTIIKGSQNKNLISFTSPFDGYLYFNAYSNTEVKNVTLSMKELSNYEPYKENICYVDCGDETIYLRSLPNGVHDEIDLETGKYIQRVGEITFNGTEDWQLGYSSWSNAYTYYNNGFVDIKPMPSDDDSGGGQAYYDAIRCPQLHRSYMSRLAWALIDGVCSYYYNGYQRIFISKQDCATIEKLKLWLQENPVTIQYELPEPIVKDIVIHNYPHSYEDGHVIIENGDPNTPIPAQLTYRAVTNRSGQIQQHTEQVEKQEIEINELETLILANIHLSQTR